MSDNSQWPPAPEPGDGDLPASELPTQAVVLPPQGWPATPTNPPPPGGPAPAPPSQPAGQPGTPGPTYQPPPAPSQPSPPYQPAPAYQPPPGSPQAPGYQPPNSPQPTGYQPPSYQAPNSPQTPSYQQPGPAYQAPPGYPANTGRSGGRSTVLAGVLGGIVVLALLGIGILALTRGDPTTDTTGGTTQPSGGSATSGATTTTVNDRIGRTVNGIELQPGDCINYDTTGGNITTFDVVACTASHLAEISAQAEHPAAGGTFPGSDALAEWSRDRCTSFSNQFLGTDSLDTSLEEYTLTPDFNDWKAGLYRVSCLVSRYDRTPLTESIRNKGASYPRPAQVDVLRLKVGDCFDPVSGEAVKIARTEQVKLSDCNGAHKGYFFGRGVLSGYPSGAPFPGQDAVDKATVALCDKAFSDVFGVASTGFVYRYWDPADTSWKTDDRRVACAVIDNEGLPATLDFASYRSVGDLDAAACFVLPPERTRDSLELGDKVATVDCANAHNGQVIARGTIPARKTYPGTTSVKNEVLADCDRGFATFVGIAADKSKYSNYTFWYPNENGFSSGDLRYSCALVNDTATTGSIQGAKA